VDKELREAVLRTLAYSDIFDFPLTQQELHYFLEGYPIDPGVLFTALPSLTGIECRDDFFCLSGREQIIDRRVQLNIWSFRKLQLAKLVAAKLAMIPWVRMIAVTGAVAAKNADQDHDIDIFIITSPKRLWVTRFTEKAMTELMGRRRRPLAESEEGAKDKICPNIYLDAGELTFPNQDLFTAREIAQMEVVFNKNYTYERFLRANSWMEKWLPNWCSMTLRKNSDYSESGINPPLAERGGFSVILDFLESLTKAVQLKYMAGKRTTETISDNLLMFHPRDQRVRVMREYQKRLLRLGVF